LTFGDVARRWIGADGGDSRVDLSEDSRFLTELLDSPLQWRERLVEELVFGGSAHVRATSSYQVSFPPELLHRHIDASRSQTANILLPVALRAKRPLLNLDITGPSGAPAHLLSRASIASLQAEYLQRLAETSPTGPKLATSLPAGLLEAVCVFTPDLYRSFARRRDQVDGLTDYLRSGLGVGVPLEPDDVERWRRTTARARDVLTRRLDLPPSTESSAEEVDPVPQTVKEVDALVAAFARVVDLADRADDQVFLGVLAEYGRRWEMIVEVEVPLWEPSTIKVAEDRPLNPNWRRWSVQQFAFADAKSTHLECRVSDPNVAIGGFQVRDAAGKRIGLGPLESVRRTDESFALYSSEPERPDMAEVRLRLRLARHHTFTSVALILLNAGAIAVALLGPTESDTFVDRLAVLSVPTTLAAAFVLAREQSALALRLQVLPRILLGMTTAALWIVVLLQIATVRPGE
jgi:hypothetical protein